MRKLLVILILCPIQLLSAQNERLFNVENRMFPPRFLQKKRLGFTPVLKHANWQAGDTIVDIGAGNGWFSCALAMHHDSLTFYLEEIDSAANSLERRTLAIRHYSKLKGSSLTSQFIPILGTDTQIPLPDQSVHAILLIDTYHHFSKRTEMLQEMHRILKKEGKLFVVELIARKEGDIHPGCRSKLWQENTLVNDFGSHPFDLSANVSSGREYRRKKRLFIFTKH